MTIEGVRADMETAQRKFDLERLFVPLSVLPIPPEISDSDRDYIKKMERWKREHPGLLHFGDAIYKYKKIALLALPGGGKTLLMKRLAVAYADDSRMLLSNDNLPKLALFPILIRCREWREHIKKPILYLLEHLHEITGEPELRGLANAIKPLLLKGGVLILIDGLDEIHNDADREIFVEHLENFVTDYPKNRLVVTSREAGFSLAAPCLTRFCDRWRVAPLSVEAISRLSRSWHELMGGASSASDQDADALTETILTNPSLHLLAENPLLLTMLLVVKHGAGRLPPDRVTLYDRAVEVLLDTWNIKGHEALSPKEAVPQLAYVAYRLLRDGRQTATERELLIMLEECRSKIPMIRRYTKDFPHEFLKRVELRSSLVVEAGRSTEGGKIVPFYQFRHLTFQEYLAAVAAVEGLHPNYVQGETLLKPLAGAIVAEEWKEVIPMAAVLARKQAEPLIKELVVLGGNLRAEHLKSSQSKKRGEIEFLNDDLPPPISRLVQCLIEAAEIPQELLSHVLQLVAFFARGCQSSDNWIGLSRGLYREELIQQALLAFMSTDWPRQTWLNVTVARLIAFRTSLDEPGSLERLKSLIQSDQEKERCRGLLALCGIFWGTTEPPESLLPLLDAIENIFEYGTSKAEVFALSWAIGRFYDEINRVSAVTRLPRRHIIDKLISDWFVYEGETKRIVSYALAGLLSRGPASWKPTLSERQRDCLRSYIKPVVEDSSEIDSAEWKAALFLGIHSGNTFSDGDASYIVDRLPSYDVDDVLSALPLFGIIGVSASARDHRSQVGRSKRKN